MPRQSETGNVKKICGCAAWKTCAHPWYVDYREGKEIRPDGKVRERGLRKRLAPLVGREPVDFADAKADADAMRAFAIASGQLPNVAVSEGSNGSEPIQSSNGPVEKTEQNAIVH